MTEIPLDHIRVVPFGHVSWRYGWYLWPEHLRTLTNLPNASALTEETAGKLDYRACKACRKQEGESSILVAGYP